MNIKIYIQGLFGNKYLINKKLIKADTGDVFFREPQEYKEFFDLENNLSDSDRTKGIETLFNQYLNLLFEKMNTIEKIKNLYKKGELFLLPAVKDELGL